MMMKLGGSKKMMNNEDHVCNDLGNTNNGNKELYHVIHKVPSGDGPYVRAKHAQLVDKDPEAAIVWFWKAINAGDKIESALKDMAVVMKQLDRTEEAIEAIKSFRRLCSKNSQDSLDNVLIDLYKKAGKVEEQILLLKQKLRLIYQGEAFNGRPTKTARSHGKKFQVSVQQEISRLLGNLGWAYMQQSNYIAAEVVYRKAQMIEPDGNKACNLSHCLIKQGRFNEARFVLEQVFQRQYQGCEDPKSRARAEELWMELESVQPSAPAPTTNILSYGLEEDFVDGLQRLMEGLGSDVVGQRRTKSSRRLPIFEQIASFRDHEMAC
uniref:Uncharacterized protein n=1 Tax=Kalanchoe fedtschenkoi TaxID=63787 RepID=A0A7N0VNG3_KALFE